MLVVRQQNQETIRHAMLEAIRGLDDFAILECQNRPLSYVYTKAEMKS